MEENYGQGTEKKSNAQEVKDAFRSGTPEDVKESVKKTVEKGVAAVAGALKGVADTAEREDVAGATKSAVRQIGETTKELTKEGQKQFDAMREQVRERKSGAGTTATTLDDLGVPTQGAGLVGGEPALPTSDLGPATQIGDAEGAAGPKPSDKDRRREMGGGL